FAGGVLSVRAKRLSCRLFGKRKEDTPMYRSSPSRTMQMHPLFPLRGLDSPLRARVSDKGGVFYRAPVSLTRRWGGCGAGCPGRTGPGNTAGPAGRLAEP